MLEWVDIAVVLDDGFVLVKSLCLKYEHDFDGISHVVSVSVLAIGLSLRAGWVDIAVKLDGRSVLIKSLCLKYVYDFVGFIARWKRVCIDNWIKFVGIDE